MATFSLLTEGDNDIVNITNQIKELVSESGKSEGLVNIFLPSTTSALTIMEDEPGAVADLQRSLEQLAPREGDYQHNAKWGDGNGHAHVRSALIQPVLSVPLIDGELALGTWQSIVLIDFDIKERTRTIHVNIY